MDDLSSLTVAELKKQLQSRSLKISGPKKDLILRLRTSIEEDSKQKQYRGWKDFEIEYLLKLNKQNKDIKTMAKELNRTESAVRQKLRLVLIEQKLICEACNKKFESEKSLNIHQAKKQDDAHKKLKGKTNEKNDKKEKHKHKKKSKNNEKNDKKEKHKHKKESKTNEKQKHKKESKTVKKIIKTTKKKTTKKKSKKKTSTKNTNNNEIVVQPIINNNITINSESTKTSTKKRKNMSDYSDDEPPKKKKKIKSKLDWNEDECSEWIVSLGKDYKQYAKSFKNAGINGDFLNDLDDDTLTDIVENKLHRRKILHAWNKIN